MKNLLAGEQQAAVTVAVEALMDAKPEAEAFATFDPKVHLRLLAQQARIQTDPMWTASIRRHTKPDRCSAP